MNRQQIRLLVLCTFLPTATYAAMAPYQLASALPNYKMVENILAEDYTYYVQNRFDEYKKTDLQNMSTFNFDELIDMSKTMTGRSCGIDVFRQLHDEHNNFFIHVAVNKRDLPAVQWLYAHDALHQWVSNSDKNLPLDCCIQQLLPEAVDNEQNKKSISLAILKTIVASEAQYVDHKEIIKETVAKLINLELACAARSAKFKVVIEPEMLNNLIAKVSYPAAPLSLNRFYQLATDDKTGDTFTHVWVGLADPDKLLKWVKSGRVSFAHNKDGKNALDYALFNFRHLIKYKSSYHSELLQKRRCCLFILLNYCKLKDNAQAICDFCCDKHTIKL